MKKLRHAQIKVKLLTEIVEELSRPPGDCAVFAVCRAWRMLKESGGTSKILMFSDARHAEAHAALCFETPGQAGVMVYDRAGTIDIADATLQWTALAVARRAFGAAVLAAYWFGNPRRPETARRLSPAEARAHLPSLARLLEQDAAPVHARRMSPRELRTVGHSFDLLMETRER